MSETNPNSRLEAFCDGVFAIAITLLIIEIKVPPISSVHTRGELWMAFAHDLPAWFAFLLSFSFILISWVNHSHVFKLIGRSSSNIYLCQRIVNAIRCFSAIHYGGSGRVS